MKSLFVEAPDSVFPLLDKNQRADCVDFFDAGMQYGVTNKLEGKTTLVDLAPDYMLLETSGTLRMELKKLPLGDDFIICVVNTVTAEASDSRVAFFSSSWKRLDTSCFFAAPSIREFFTSQSAADEFLNLCEIYLVSLKLNSADTGMVAEYTMPSYMNKDDADRVLSHLRRIVFVWDGKSFVQSTES
ncbi:MAG: DUF3256 family protein [Bacteroidaceae bacterium]|nr:DUF3256 family protein [Bacteroidaceae bacterium]